MKKQGTARICVPVCVSRASEIAPAIARAAEVADIIELRLDCLTEADFYEVERHLAELLQHSPRPLIFTFRPAEQGGQRELGQKKRFDFWCSEGSKLTKDTARYVDVELDAALFLAKAEKYLGTTPDWSRVICSYHDFIDTHSDLEQIRERMNRTPARILKIAVQADDITDCLPVLQLLESARRSGREMIVIAMGAAGILTRILAPSRGAFLTYGALDEKQKTAPGQIKAIELRDLYRVHQLNHQTEIMGLVGQPVGHTFSPYIHNAAFAARGMNAVYIPFEVHQLNEFMNRMVDPRTRELEWKLRGLSVTAPHKQAIMRHLDWIEPSAQEIGAVNTVVVKDQTLLGYNTDTDAALAPLRDVIELSGARVAVIGAGGAARALLWILRDRGARVTVFARSVERATEAASKFGAQCERLGGASFGEFDLVINATPLGTRGYREDETPAIASQLRGARIAYDLVYNPRETRFMREALTAGCHTLGGLDMLVAQAAAQFELWTGAEAPFAAMREAAEKAVMSDK
ncbi:MAG: shikimate dehydrogenase [Pyrinomonadaceae bacterium]|nr:shikimate dehydrogenase [Pyrinomonadaceae bacterium]